jgi:hypothetical protein
MFAMQAFHNRLFSETGERNLYWSGLLQLTRAAKQVQLAALQAAPSWGTWNE